ITFMAVVPVSEIKQSAGLQIYPNPTMDALYVTGTNVGETVRVFTLNGRLVLSGTASDTVLQLPVSGLEAGVYLLQIDTQISKFIKR
ncbi:MAG TPA: T9SS type A sorting domain-containing protein, partial [Paludibacteraceae bacterium]|nr:T9SS type A sorting domain-containing protein [Paludibacteraceae bacterium]